MTTNSLTGSNPGPVINTAPDLSQLPVGDVQKVWAVQQTLSPASVAANTSAEQTFLSTGIGYQVGDYVLVNKPTAQAGLGIVGMRISATDTLAITFGNFTASPIVPTASEVYGITIIRPMNFANQAGVTF